MGIFSGGGGAFNGGTITKPLVVDLSAADGTTVPLTVKASYNAQGVDFLSVINSDTGFDVAAVSSAAALQTYDRTTGAAKGTFPSSSNVPDFSAKDGYATQAITSGALPTVALSSGVAAQVSPTGRDVLLVVPVTFNPTGILTSTCKVELSPDNVTFSTLVTKTLPALAALAGLIDEVTVVVPGTWYVKLTATNAVLGAGTYY